MNHSANNFEWRARFGPCIRKMVSSIWMIAFPWKSKKRGCAERHLVDTESCLRGDVGYRQSRGLSNSALWCRSTPRLVTIDRERCDASTTRFFDEIGDSQSSTSVESEQDQLSDVSLRFDMDDRNQRGRLYVIGAWTTKRLVGCCRAATRWVFAFRKQYAEDEGEKRVLCTGESGSKRK